MSIKVLTLFGEEIIEEPVAKEEKKRAARAKKQEQATGEDAGDATGNEQQVTGTENDGLIVAKKKQVKPRKHLQAGNNAEPKVLEGWKAEKQYYGIGEVAKLFAVNVSHIRFWTNEFEIKVRTNRKGDRMYNPASIEQLRVIFHLVKEKGFTIAGAKIKLKERKRSPEDDSQLREKLLSLKEQLTELRNRI